MWKITLSLILGVRRPRIGDILGGLVGHKMASSSAKQVYDAYHASWDAVIFWKEEEENQSASNFQQCIVEIGQCLSMSRSLR